MTEQTGDLLLVKRHSRLGIAATIIAVTLPILLVVLIFGGGTLLSIIKKGDNENAVTLSLVLTILSLPLIHLLGLILGLIGLFSKKTKKLFPIIGSVLNAVLLLLGVTIIVLILVNFPVIH
jgi:hypothetical protein